ncbi:MAG: tyrosine-type recombinase/integrase [Thermomicrobiales bacterium]
MDDSMNEASPDSRSAPADEAASHRSRFADRDAVSAQERDTPPAGSPQLAALEADAAQTRAHRPDQLALDLHTETRGAFAPELGGLVPLDAGSSLDLARSWFRRDLELARRPKNTIESYRYDLQKLEEMIGPKAINRIDRTDIARFLGDANSRTTRKRRLTSLRQFFAYLIKTEKVLKLDPTEGYFPHQIALRTPQPLFPDEQQAILDAAARDEPWSTLAIWLMMRVGLTRSELLALERDHVDRASEPTPVVNVYYETPGKQVKERRLATSEAFAEVYEAYLSTRGAELTGRLVPVGPPAVNGMVERVRRAADIGKDVTPQTLRHTFAVEQARNGADADDLLALLGLADDGRNRASVERYIRLASPALPTDSPRPEPDRTEPTED